MERRKANGKCYSLNSPKALRGFPRGKCLRAEALGWNGWQNTSLEANQSFPSQLPSQNKMDWFQGDGMNLASFSNRKWAFNQSPIHVSSSRDEAWLLNETSLNTSTHPSNSHFEGTLPLPNTSKAVFTIHLPSTQILIVNSVACKLLGYTAEELCGLTLKDLLPDAHQLSNSGLDANPVAPSALGTGTVVELKTREGIRIPVFLFFKKVETPQRCVAVAELVDRRVATLNTDNDYKVLSFDEEMATMFQYDHAELHCVNLKDLIPSVNLNVGNQSECCKQRITGRTKAGVSFPLCLVARPTSGLNGGWHVVLWVYSNLSGVIVLNSDLSIANCNNLFTTLLFGYSKESLAKQSILKLLPGFHEDGEYGRERTVTGDKSDSSNSEPTPGHPDDGNSTEVKDVETPEDKTAEDYLQVEIDNATEDCARLVDELVLDGTGDDDSSTSVLKESDLELQNEMTEKLKNLHELKFCVWGSSRLRSSRSDDILTKIKPVKFLPTLSATSNLDLQGTGLQEFPMNRALNVSNLSDLEGEKPVVMVREGTFAGRGRHRDGADIDVVYRVREARGRKGYCVCIARDPWEAAEGGRGPALNLTITSSFNSTSLDGSFTKDSEANSRPNSASIISQSDDVLTSGEYSEYYTNLQQIGKGAFGYVKMAYRNEDGLLAKCQPEDCQRGEMPAWNNASRGMGLTGQEDMKNKKQLGKSENVVHLQSRSESMRHLFQVITKFIKKQKIHVRSWVVDPTLQMKVPLEISLLTTLEHPHIVRVLDVFHNDAFFQLVMEKHGAGMDLFEFIDRKPKLDEKLSSFIFRQIVSAIHYLHSLGILHRDIKDENVIINEAFHVKLIDFGSAAFMTPDRLFSTFYGTVEYCSPEVLQGNKYRGPELEVWALGVTLYVLTFGENPFYDVEETIKGEFLMPRPVSSQLFSLMKGMLEKDVELRWDIEKIVQDSWVNLSVDPNNYSFTKIVRCFHDEAYPAKYISDYGKEELGKEEEDEDRTVASSNSFCSLHTIENLDDLDSLRPVPSIVSEIPQRVLSASPYILSSTPRRAKATKSVSVIGAPTESKTQKRYSLDLNTLKKLCDDDSGKPDEDTASTPKANLTERDESFQRVEFYDSLEQKPGFEDFDSYWDAEDEQFDEDSF